MKYFLIGCVAYIFNMISPFWIVGILRFDNNDSNTTYCALTLLSSIVIACTFAIVDAIKKEYSIKYSSFLQTERSSY